MRFSIDNTTADQSVKSISATLVRTVRAVTAIGTEFVERTELMKRKSEEVVFPKKQEERLLEFPLAQINLHDKHMEVFKAKKPHIVAELKDWVTTLQHSLKTPSLECKYHLEVDVKHTGVFGKEMPTITIPIQVYYHNNIFVDQLTNTSMHHLYQQTPYIPPNPYLKSMADAPQGTLSFQ